MHQTQACAVKNFVLITRRSTLSVLVTIKKKILSYLHHWKENATVAKESGTRQKRGAAITQDVISN